MKSVDYYKSIIKSRLSEGRYIHSLNVAASAAELSKIYNCNRDKAYLAGLLHDITKEESLDVQYRLIEENSHSLTKLERNNPSVIHQMSGEAYCRLKLGITDEEILSAIRYHTTGKANMTTLQKVVYTADFISADRNYPDVDIMRKKTDTDFFDGMLYSLTYTITKLAQQSKQIHPDTLHCYNWVLDIKNMKQKGNVK